MNNTKLCHILPSQLTTGAWSGATKRFAAVQTPHKYHANYHYNRDHLRTKTGAIELWQTLITNFKSSPQLLMPSEAVVSNPALAGCVSIVHKTYSIF